jgi:hypothetical protein
MPLDDIYDVGTIDVEEGSPTVIGNGVVWTDVYKGDELRILEGANAGLAVPILSVGEDFDVITLPVDWPGETLEGAAYLLSKRATSRLGPTGEVLERIFKFVTDLAQRGLFLFTAIDPPDPELGEDGQWALKTNADPWKLWLKVDGVWVPQNPPTIAEQLTAVERADQILSHMQAFSAAAMRAARVARAQAQIADATVTARAGAWVARAQQIARRLRLDIEARLSGLLSQAASFAAMAQREGRSAKAWGMRAAQYANSAAGFMAGASVSVRRARAAEAAAAQSASDAADSAAAAAVSAGEAAVDALAIKLTAESFT